MKAFREAVEARDVPGMSVCLADDVVFLSPIEEVLRGRAMTAAILETSMEVLAGFRYVRQMSSTDGRDHALVFSADVNGLPLTGCDFLHLDETGRIDNFMVMVRPQSAARTLAAEMAARRPQTLARARR